VALDLDRVVDAFAHVHVIDRFRAIVGRLEGDSQP